jgi:hypothetical protein
LPTLRPNVCFVLSPWRERLSSLRQKTSTFVYRVRSAVYKALPAAAQYQNRFHSAIGSST